MRLVLLPLLALLVGPPRLSAQDRSPNDAAIVKQLQGLRALPDADRGKQTGDLAMQIRALPASERKVALALGLAHLATEGDPGRANLQAVATTLSAALVETPAPPNKKTGEPSAGYMELAELVRFEGLTLDPAMMATDQFIKATEELTANDAEIEKVDFTLKDLKGKAWKLSELRGKVVVVNFWATWCPPCRKELPDLDAIYTHFQPQGLVVLGLDDEDGMKINTFFQGSKGLSYPVLLDSGGKTAKAFHVGGIPKTFVFDRDGKLVAQSMDMRTQQQFLRMLAKAGIHAQK